MEEKEQKVCRQCSNHCPLDNLRCAVGKRALRIQQEKEKQRTSESCSYASIQQV